MKFIVIVLVCCAMIGQIESQATGNRPNFIQSFFAPIGQFFSIFRRQTRPGVQADASIQQTGGQVDATASIFTDPQLVQENLNSIQQIQAEPVLQTQFVTEVMTVFSTIPSLERVTSIETVVEMTTETVFETVKMTQFKTEHITMTHTTGVCSTATPSSSKASSSSSSKVVEKSAVTPSAVSTSAVVQPTKKARLAPYVVKRAVEIEASSL